MKFSALLIGCFVALFATIEGKNHPDVSKKTWDAVKPYLLPENHPVKEKLDSIFIKKRAILNQKTLLAAGFTHAKPREFTHLIVTKHRDLEGYVFKIYLDAQRAKKGKGESYFWLLRIQGAEKIRSLVKEKKWDSQFKIPKKWIYHLPNDPSPPTEFNRKNFILVEEDMKVLGDQENRKKWGTGTVDTDLLKKVFFITEQLGLADCAKPDNIPFCEDGKIAFIDTQTFDEWPVHFDKMTPFLSNEMKQLWKTLIKRGRK